MMMNIVIQNAWLLHWTNLPIVSPYILVSGTCQLLALPFTIAVACVIIAILTATIIVLYRKLRQRNSSEAIKISTEGKSKLSEVKTQELTMQWITMWMMKKERNRNLHLLFTIYASLNISVIFTRCNQTQQLNTRLKPYPSLISFYFILIMCSYCRQ